MKVPVKNMKHPIRRNFWFTVIVVTLVAKICCAKDYSTDLSDLKVYEGGNKLKAIEFIKENDVAGELLEWTKVAYVLSENGKQLFINAGGNAGNYETSEPILVLQTSGSIVIFISIEYSAWNVKEGHLLIAFEFSRKLREPKRQYLLNDTFFFEANQADFFKSISEITKDAVRMGFQQ